MKTKKSNQIPLFCKGCMWVMKKQLNSCGCNMRCKEILKKQNCPMYQKG